MSAMAEMMMPKVYRWEDLNHFRSRPFTIADITTPTYMQSWYTTTQEGLPVLRMIYAPANISISGSTIANRRLVTRRVLISLGWDLKKASSFNPFII